VALWEGVDWIDLAVFRDQWRAVVNLIMKTFAFHKVRGVSWIYEEVFFPPLSKYSAP
jgi:hypothetical protein